MITNLKKRTERQAEEFQNGMEAFRKAISEQTDDPLTVTPLRKKLDRKEGILHLFDLEQTHPVKNSRKVTLAINTEGYIRCYFFGENKSGHEGVEYQEVEEYELKKSKLRHISRLRKWRHSNDFLPLYPKLTDWINAGN